MDLVGSDGKVAAGSRLGHLKRNNKQLESENAVEYGRFTETYVLRSIGRELLEELFGRFGAELAEKKLQLPTASLADDDYFREWSRLLMSPEGLPDRVNDVLHAVHELSGTAGHERLREAVEEHGLKVPWDDVKTTREEVAVRLWLEAPALVAKKCNELKLRRLSSFAYFEKEPNPFAWRPVSAGSRGRMDVLIQTLDGWCASNDRGHETVVVDKYELFGEEWYLIRHGDIYAREAKVEKRKMEVLHFRPAKDDVVVYVPRRDELRINAKTKGERNLYRMAFGYYLHGYENYFCEAATYSLEPLRKLGEAALECDDVEGVSKVVLTRLEVDLCNGQNQVYTLQADDVFACKWSPDETGVAIPPGAKLRRASFHVFIGGAKEPIELQVKPPNVLRLARHWAAPKIHEWLSARGLKGGQGKAAHAEKKSHVEPVAVS